ncbi:hypothetical protein CDD83_7001 [Cordyceps sp. RAO-2017]|nr:hypothetical protein CDD83_7001 [Cordyceps sp. RAO-2017]
MAQHTDLRLPSGFITVRDVLDGKACEKSKVSVIGLVTDVRAPIQTRGTDWKCEIRLYDESVQFDNELSLLLTIFWPEADMPDVQCGDVVIIYSATVQNYRHGAFSLVTHWDTVVHIFVASKIPSPPKDALPALRPSNRKKNRQPRREELDFVSSLYHSIDKTRIPSESEFEAMKVTSVKVRDKFRELKDVRDGTYVHTVAQIVKDPYDLVDKVNLWISDYTEHQSFFHYSFSGSGREGGQVGDPYGYLDKFSSASKKQEWTGPFGKRSMQVTCFEPHASAIRSQGLSCGSWVSLRNMHIKFGHSGSNLEGFLHEDLNARGNKINVVALDLEAPSPQLKNALHRKRDYEKAKKRQLKDIAEAAEAGRKRKAETGSDPPQQQQTKPKNAAKIRRQAKRKADRAQAEAHRRTEQEAAAIPLPDINKKVKCENEGQMVCSVADMLNPVYHEINIDDSVVKVLLPFVNANYRACVRVVDFLPPRLEEFSRLRKSSEYDCLSDDEPDSEPESESGSDQDQTPRSADQRCWEWHFFLKLEDAAVRDWQPKKRIWVLVDNQAAQCLLDQDASDLGRHPQHLDQLRQRLLTLWGESGMQKLRAAEPARAGEFSRPPDDNSDEERGGVGEEAAAGPATHPPFSCCIRQYGVKVAEKDKCKADAGDGRRWQKMFGLFGTRIVPG